MIEQAFLTQSRRLLTHSYLPRIEQAVDGLSDESSGGARTRGRTA